MMRRIARLERHYVETNADAPHVDAVVADIRRLRRWLDERGMTAAQAIAAGLADPPGLRWATLRTLRAAELHAAEYRHLRFPGFASGYSVNGVV